MNKVDKGLSHHNEFLFEKNRLYHVSENAGINLFVPRPSPAHFDEIKEGVVFAISANLLHNYLLPRDCPRVTFYASAATCPADKKRFLADPSINYVIAVENSWLKTIQQTSLYVYEFAAGSFVLLDGCAGYYISRKPVKPVSVKCIENPYAALLKRKDIEVRLFPSIRHLAEEVAKSTLNYSLIRMRNAR